MTLPHPVSGTLQLLVIERLDPARNMARYYVVGVEETLSGDASLVREWGRLGRLGGRRVELYPDREAAVEALEVWLARKRRRGYLVRGATRSIEDDDRVARPRSSGGA